MTIRHEIVCGICGLAACVCAQASPLVEARHQSERRPTITRKVEALPVESDHTHEEFDRVVRTVDSNLTVSGAPGDEMPPGHGNTLDVAVQIARRNFQAQWRRPASMFSTPPALLASGSS